MSTMYGFELVNEKYIPEINSKARLFRHLKTGAELLSLENDDENKVFGVTFRTPPADSTGLPHIMEHSVLGGSRKYRVKEPFVELIKGSMKTFVNAFTSADMTTYPVASTNVQDFYNLVDVYLDAVFYPLITPQHLEQEGWHYELEHPDDPLIYKGIVFNEMKGAYSSPDSVLYRYSKQVLFPDNVYAFDSGGDPRVMPELTYEHFKQFHEAYYHPSNARIFFYGDDDPDERLRIIDEYLKEFEAIAVDSAVPLHSPLEEPQRFTVAYSVDDTDLQKKSMVQVNWALPEKDDAELRMGLSVLSYALVGTSASPLRKALIDSDLGEDVTGGGLSANLRQMTFAIGLKGINRADAEKVEKLILDRLAELADHGFEREAIEAALNTIEFSLRENNTGSFPRGLALMMRGLSTWLYDRDPLEPLAYEAPLNAVKVRLDQDDTYLRNLIRVYLLQNSHRATVILEPDPELQRREEAAEREKLDQVRATLSDAELQAIIENTRKLKQLQEAPDDPAALAAIPRLTLADLDKDVKTIPIDVAEAHSSRLLYHDLFTNGIVYLDLGFNLHVLPAELLPYVKLFGRSLLQMGTETEDFVKLSQRIGRKTGGIYTSSFVSDVQESEISSTWLFVRGKATAEQSEELLAILRDVLLTVNLDNQERFRQMVLEAKARKEASLVPSGHSIVDTRLRAHFSEAGRVAEQMGGVSYLFFLRQLARDVENDWPSVQEKLEQVRQIVLNRNAMVVNVTLDADNWARFKPLLTAFLPALPAGPAGVKTWPSEPLPGPEGLAIPAQVNYVGKGANLYKLGYELDGSISVITNFLRTSWLWEKVRAQGGAYGAFSHFDRHSGVFSFLSYRDPNLLGTLDTYDRTVQFLRQLDLSQDELEKSIIGAISSMDAYQLPDAKGYTSMIRYLLGITDEVRQQYRDEVLSTTVADFKAFAQVLDRLNEKGLVVVMGSPEALAAANESRGNLLQVTKVM